MSEKRATWSITSAALAPRQRTMLAMNAPAVQPLPAPKRVASAAPPSSAARYGAHIGSFSTREGAERAWSIVDRRSAALGKSTDHAVYPVDLGPPKGTLYRLIAGPSASKADAQKLCDALKAEGAYCMVVSVKS